MAEYSATKAEGELLLRKALLQMDLGSFWELRCLWRSQL